jgi:hypothetical protein
VQLVSTDELILLVESMFTIDGLENEQFRQTLVAIVIGN